MKPSLFLLLVALCSCSSSQSKTLSLFLDDNNGTQSALRINEGALLKDVPIPIKRGCVLLGYQDEEGKLLPFDTKVTEGLSIKAKWGVNKDTMFELPEHPERRASGSDVRVMSFNLLCDDYNNKPKMHGYDEHNEPYPEGVDDGRDYQNRDCLWNYLPDVVAVQECDRQWQETYKRFYEEGDFSYRLVNSETTVKESGSDLLYTTLLYNEDNVELLDVQYRKYKGSDNANCRFFVVGLFLDASSNMKYMVASTHWNLITSSASTKLAQAKETVSYIEEAMNAHPDTPLILCGDFNNLDSDPSLDALQEESSFLDAKYESTSKGLLCDTYHIGNGESKEPMKWYRGEDSMLDELVDTIEARDHIYYSKGISCLYYDTVSDTRTLNSSDHMPIYSDFRL